MMVKVMAGSMITVTALMVKANKVSNHSYHVSRIFEITKLQFLLHFGLFVFVHSKRIEIFLCYLSKVIEIFIVLHLLLEL
jgi:hypothetical protein